MKSLEPRTAVCETCLNLIPAEIRLGKRGVYLQKTCPRHGTASLRISSDPAFFLDSFATLNRSHSAHSNNFSALVVELTDECDLECSTCIAGSKPGSGNHKPFPVVKSMIAAAEANPRKPDILMISGGEPTTHPQILKVLEKACNSSIPHVMLLTNGKRISEDSEFVQALAKLPRSIEVYLQFDSLTPSVLKNIRGTDFSPIRHRAIAALGKMRIATTLISVVKRGVNDHECGEVVRFALSHPHIRGVTFQPIKASGRTDSLRSSRQLIDLAAVRRQVVSAGVGFESKDIVPHPQFPENVCIGYLQRMVDGVTAVTDKLMNHRNGKNETKKSLYFLPGHSDGTFSYNSLFRVAVVSYMDKYNFCKELLPFAPIGLIMQDGSSVALDSYYMYGRKTLARSGPEKYGNGGNL